MSYKVISVHTDVQDARNFLEDILNKPDMSEYRIVGIIQPANVCETPAPALVILWSEPVYPVGGEVETTLKRRADKS